MSCIENGNSKYNIYVKEYRNGFAADHLTVNCGTNDTYGDLYDALMGSFQSNYVVDFFSYDWRLSSAVSAQKLDDYIERYEYDEVILVSHSMGGLVTSGYLALGEAQRNKVDQVYFLASPLLGTPAVANIWYNEDLSIVENVFGGDFLTILDLAITAYEIRTSTTKPIQQLISNYVSVYEAFPSEYHFQLQTTDSSYLSSSSGLGFNKTEYTSYASTKTLLIDNFNRFDANLMALAEDFHDSIFSFDGRHVSDGVDAYYYYCTTNDPNNPDTPTHMNLQTSLLEQSLTVDVYSTQGDMLVLKDSATLKNLDSTREEDLAQTTNVDLNHTTIISNGDSIDRIITRISQTH